MIDFTYTSFAQRIVFAEASAVRLVEEATMLGFTRVAVVTGPFHAGRGRALLDGLREAGAVLIDTAIEHTPLEVTEAAMTSLSTAAVDGLVSIGGGAAIGLAKALATRGGFGLLAVPTTFAGSEMTAVLGERRGSVKSTRRDERVVPRTVVYDIELVAEMPPSLAATSGMNALAHAFEALWAPDASPLTNRIAGEAIALLGSGLPRAVARLEVPADALLGAYYAGCCLATTSMGLHHRLCHVLGGMCALPHSPTHAVLLPYVVALNAPSAETAMRRAATALELTDVEDVPEALFALADRIGTPRSLRELGMDARQIPEVAAILLAADGANPAPLDRTVLLELLDAAWAGW